jgi:hypothetical protein
MTWVLPSLVIPAKAGIQAKHARNSLIARRHMDSRFRGNDEGGDVTWRRGRPVTSIETLH